MARPAEIPLSVDDCRGLERQQADACISQYYRRVDNDMSVIYRDLASRLSAKDRSLLQKAQQSWTEFRDHSCDFAGLKFEGGPLQPSAIGLCMVSLTEGRIKDLSDALQYYKQRPTRKQ